MAYDSSSSSYQSSDSASASGSAASALYNPYAQTTYNNLLAAAGDQYQRIYQSYLQGIQGYQAQQLNALGYNTLMGQIGQTLGQGGGWGVATPAAQQIAQAYAQARGSTTQALTNAGLGNTSAVTAAQNQNALMAAQSYGNLGALLADKFAGYQSNIGLQSLQAQNQSWQNIGDLAKAYMQVLGGWRLPEAPQGTYFNPVLNWSRSASESQGSGVSSSHSD